jgi:hypothetical protein
MQSTNMHQIKAALWDQAFTGNACVSCPIGPVVAERREEGTTLGVDTRVGALVSSGVCAY